MSPPSVENTTANLDVIFSYATSDRAFHIAALPYPGRGHINPMLSICRLIAAKGVLVTVVVTEEWVDLLTALKASLPPNVRLRAIPNVLVSERLRGENFPAFVAGVYTKMAGPVQELLEGLDLPVHGILVDSSLPWHGELAGRMDLPVGSLRSQLAMLWLVLLNLRKVDAGRKIAQRYLDGVKDLLHYLPKADPEIFDSQMNYLKRVIWCAKAQSLLFTSCYDIESRIFNVLHHQLKVSIHTLSPSILFMTISRPAVTSNAASYLIWLDAQLPSSVLFISLGSFLSLSGPQRDEMAKGFRTIGTCFLWVVRDEAGSANSELAGGKSMVVQWCDQLLSADSSHIAD